MRGSEVRVLFPAPPYHGATSQLRFWKEATVPLVKSSCGKGDLGFSERQACATGSTGRRMRRASTGGSPCSCGSLCSRASVGASLRPPPAGLSMASPPVRFAGSESAITSEAALGAANPTICHPCLSCSMLSARMSRASRMRSPASGAPLGPPLIPLSKPASECLVPQRGSPVRPSLLYFPRFHP
jgi:hypothetical protein